MHWKHVIITIYETKFLKMRIAVDKLMRSGQLIEMKVEISPFDAKRAKNLYIQLQISIYLDITQQIYIRYILVLLLVRYIWHTERSITVDIDKCVLSAPKHHYFKYFCLSRKSYIVQEYERDIFLITTYMQSLSGN